MNQCRRLGVEARQKGEDRVGPDGMTTLQRQEFIGGWADEDERLSLNQNRMRKGLPLIPSL